MEKAKSVYTRDVNIDIMKGICIILVVLSHTYFAFNDMSSCFSMPIFFMLSGYVLHFDKIDNIKDWFIIRSVRLLIPYFSFFFLIFILSNHINFYQFIKEFGKIIYSGKLVGGIYGVWWFIPCLIISQLIVVFIHKKIKQIYYKVYLYSFFIFISLVWSNYIHQGIDSLYFFQLPWNLDVAILASVYVLVGTLLFKYRDIYQNILKKYGALVIVINIYVIAYILNYRYFAMLDMKYSLYKDLFSVSILPIFSFLSLQYVCSYLSRLHYFSNIFVYIGRASMVIMYTHNFIKYQWFLPIWGTQYSIGFFLVVSTLIGCSLFYFLNKYKLSKKLFIG